MFSYGNMVFEFDDPSVPDGLKVISNEGMDFNDMKEINDPHVLIFNLTYSQL